MFELNKLTAIQVKLASPEKILEWSKGEVKNSETINYRTQKPEPDGLFCEKIFGPTKDYQCYCGKYKKPKSAGTVCEKCGVEVTTKAVRRERMGHITLCSPCTHIWYLKGTPSRISVLLGVPPKQIEEVVYYISHIVLNAGTSKFLNKCDVLDERSARETFKNILQGYVDTLQGSDLEEAKTYLSYVLDTSMPVDFKTVSDFINKIDGAEFDWGASAIQKLLKEVDLDKELENIQNELKQTNSPKNQKRINLLKRLELVDAFKKSHNDPSWMVLTVLPVMPPDLRPMLPLDGGRYAASDLNDLYRRVIGRNTRLKRFIDQKAPQIITINERRMLQEAVDALIDNGRRSKAVTGAGNRALKSLSSQLKGKQGRFRQNLLGKRVDYSGRSVIAVGPFLNMDQCGIPREMAINLFRPFIAAKLMEDKVATTRKAADNLIDNMDPKVMSAVEVIIKDHPVLLNRAPTLHRLGIQAFRPILVEGRAIRLHPLVCTGFNADFDGDQMAVHVPLSKAAQKEAIDLMIANHNILGPKDGEPICIPSQDMLLGNYYITMENDVNGMLAQAKYYRQFNDEQEALKYELYAKCEGKVFKDIDEVMRAYDAHLIHLQSRIAIRASAVNKTYFNSAMKKAYLLTTPGKLIFNSIYPSDFPYINDSNDTKFDHSGATPLYEQDDNYLPKFFVPYGTNIKEAIAKNELTKPIGKKEITNIITELFAKYQAQKTSEILDKIKNLGFEFSTISGITVALCDISANRSDGSPSPLDDKKDLYEETEKQVLRWREQADDGELNEEERYNKVINAWKDVTKQVTDKVSKLIALEPRNPVFIMSASGARGKLTNFVQLIGIKGLMAKPDGSSIEIPIKSCYSEGLSVSEFFIATHGARKTGADTALKTADSGYLTRRLIDVSHDVIVREEDCGCDHGIILKDIMNRESRADDVEKNVFPQIAVHLENRLVGRFAARDVIDPRTGEVIIPGNTMISQDQASKVSEAGIKEVEIRSLFSCETKDGVCVHCYGKNLATGRLVEIGDAVGIMAAQSIGEPGTQLTLKNFHSGGVAGEDDITQGLPRVQEVLESRIPKGEACITEIGGIVTEIREHDKDKKIYDITIENKSIVDEESKEFETKTYTTNAHAYVIVRVGQQVKAGQKLTAGAIDPKKLLDATSVSEVETYLLEEVEKVYESQGIHISDKHVEVIAKQMLRKMLVVEAGDTNLLPGTRVDIVDFTNANNEVLLQGKHPAVGRPIVLGITKAALDTNSFLSSASFQETTRVLTDAAVKGKVDRLHGLKENVMIGKLIPAGTGFYGDTDSDVIDDTSNLEETETVNEEELTTSESNDSEFDNIQEAEAEN